MSSVRPHLIVANSGQSDAGHSQNHSSNKFAPIGGRGRGTRAAGAFDRGVAARDRVNGYEADPSVMRADLPEKWSVFVRRVFTSRDGCAVYFGVTMQTACNWFDGGVCRPSGHVVAVAALNFPAAFSAVMMPVPKQRVAA